MEMKQEKGLEGKEQEPKNPKLLDQVRQIIKVKHYSIRTEESYIQWIKRYIIYHKKKHPKDMGEREIGEFLSYLANECKVTSSTQNQALSAILFLYHKVLGKELATVLDMVKTSCALVTAIDDSIKTTSNRNLSSLATI